MYVVYVHFLGNNELKNYNKLPKPSPNVCENKQPSTLKTVGKINQPWSNKW